MEYMGRKVSESDQQKMRQSLGIQPGGKVIFQEFADLVKNMFKFKLDMSMMEPTLMGSIERKDNMEMPPLRKVGLNTHSQGACIFISCSLSHRVLPQGSLVVICHITHKREIHQSMDHMIRMLN